MKKKIKKLGTSKRVYFTKEECEILDIHIGDVIEIQIKKCKFCENIFSPMAKHGYQDYSLLHILNLKEMSRLECVV